MKKMQQGAICEGRARGFSLFEVLIAIALLLLGATGPVALTAHSLKSLSPARNKLIATFLAQEAGELVRNIRDNNVHIIRTGGPGEWDDGFCPGGVYPCEREISCGASACSNGALVLQSYGGNFIKQSSSGFYTYASGVDTVFRRKITFKDVPLIDPSFNLEQVEYVVEVIWQDRFSPLTVRLTGYLTNW